MLSIICTTYNQEKFIAKSLEGFIMQKTNFPIEIIVHDDASTDNTVEIIKEYEAQFPNLFVNIYQAENQLSKGIDRVTRITFAAARGKYIAWCEGDDYWTDPNKLQKQVDFLEANPDYSICFHQAKSLFEDGSEILYNQIAHDASFDILDLTQGNFISTASCVFRVHDHIRSIPDWFLKLSVGDWGIHMLNASKGKIFFMCDCMSVYRIHSGGMWASLSSDEACKKEIEIMDQLNDAFNYEYDKYFQEGKAKRLASYKNQLIIKPTIQKEPFGKRVKQKLIKYFRTYTA